MGDFPAAQRPLRPADGLTHHSIMVIVFIKGATRRVGRPALTEMNHTMPVRTAAAAAALLGAGLLAAACSPASGSPASPNGGIVAVGAENEYANVIGQVGGEDRPRPGDPQNPPHPPAHVR